MDRVKMSDLFPWIAALMGLLSTAITALVGWRNSRDKQRTDLTIEERKMLSQDQQTLRNAWREDYEQARGRLREVEERLEKCEDRMRELERENDRLHARLREAGVEEDQP